MKKLNNFTEYSADFPKTTQAKLKQMRALIKKEVKGYEECISYGIPTFRLNGRNLVHFAAFKKHIGLYPGAAGIAAFKKQLAKYTHAKGSVQFSLDEPLPLPLIKKMVQFCVKQNKALLATKK